jgi:hypothetical protein
MYTPEIASWVMTYIRIFITIVIGVLAILRFYLSNLNGYSVGITDKRDL